jgi:hypothetical protein
MTAQELVGRLLMEGKITNEEAITLLAQQETITVFNTPESQVETVDDKLDKLLDAEFKNELLYPDGEYETRVKEIVDFMHKVDWRWLGEVVTADKFVQVLMDNVRSALKQLREDYKNGVVKEDLHTFSETGGIEVNCKVNEFDEVCIDVTFTAGDWFQTISLEDLVS